MTTFDGAPITDATVSAFRETMAKYGADPAETLAKHGIETSPVPALPISPPPAVHEPDLNAAKLPRLSNPQLEQAADQLSKHWTGDPRVLHEAFERAGLTEVDDAADRRTELEQGFDATFGAPESGDEYDLGNLFVGRVEYDAYERAEIAGAVRSSLHEMKIPKVLGASIAEAMVDAAASGWAAQRDDNAKQQYAMEQQALTCRILGVSSQTVTDTIRPLVAGLSPANKELWAESGALESASVLCQLYRNAERVALRNKGMR